MSKLITYLTGAFALGIVVAAVISAVIYSVQHNTETLLNLATSTIQGVGVSIGGIVGSAIVLRFKAARHFIKRLLEDLK
jgi:uncharacterized membrane protein YfcA